MKKNAVSLYDRARNLYLHTRYRRALRVIEATLKADPHDFDSLQMKGAILSALSRPVSEQIGWARRVLRLYPRSPEPYLNIAELMDVRDSRAALPYYRKALRRLGPRDYHIADTLFSSYAECLEQLGRYEEALRMIKRGLRHPVVRKKWHGSLKRIAKHLKAKEL